MKDKGWKILGILGMILSAGGSVLFELVSEKNHEKQIDKKVEEMVNKKLGKGA